jgi:hypothetical protein
VRQVEIVVRRNELLRCIDLPHGALDSWATGGAFMKSYLISTSRFALGCVAASAFLVTNAVAEEKKEEAKWDVSAPPGLTIREIPISVDEGTWMNVDISPDGRLLG